MPDTLLVERLRAEQAAGITPIESRDGVAVVAALSIGFALLISVVQVTATLVANDIVNGARAENGGQLGPDVAEELCRTASCVPGDLLFYAPLITIFAALFLLFGMVVAAFARKPWRLKLGVVGLLTTVVLAIPYAFFADVIRTVTNLVD